MTQSLALLSPDMSAGERRLILAAVRGEVADLGDQAVRGSVLRDLLEGARPGWVVHATGLKVQRARFTGGVDLEGCRFDKPLFMSRVVIGSNGQRAALAIEDARLERVSLHDVRLDGALFADRTVFANGFFLSACDIAGPLQLRGASVHGTLAVEASQIGDGVLGLDATHLNVLGPVVLRRACLRGESRLVRARLGGALQAEGAEFGAGGGAYDRANLPGPGEAGEEMCEAGGAAPFGLPVLAGGRAEPPLHPALDLSGAQVRGDILLTTAKGHGAVVARHIQVSGAIAASGFSLTGGGFDLGGSILEHGLTLDEARLDGTLGFDGARLGGAFLARGLEVHGGRIAIGAARSRIAGDADLERSKLVGLLDVRGAHVSGSVRLTATRVYGAADAVAGESVAVGGDIAMDKSVVFGCVRLGSVSAGGSLTARGASLKVERGAAFMATGAQVGGDVLLCDGLRTIGAVLIERARVGGRVDFSESHVTALALAGDMPARRADKRGGVDRSDVAEHYRHHAIALADSVMNRLVMPRRAESRPRGIVDLARAHAVVFEDFAAAWPPPVEARAAGPDGRDGDHLVLAGFVYDDLVNPSGEAGDATGAGAGSARARPVAAGERRIAWLEAQSAHDVAFQFRPDAWRQLARRLAAQGFEEDARTVDVARRRWQARSLDQSRLARWRARIFDLVALFGYSPWRSLTLLAVMVLAFAGLYAWAARQCPQPHCLDNGVFIASRQGDYPARDLRSVYPAFDPLAFSLESAVPFVDLGTSAHWQINARWRLSERGATAGDARSAAGEAAQGTAGASASEGLTFGRLLSWARIIETLAGLALIFLATASFLGVFRDKR